MIFQLPTLPATDDPKPKRISEENRRRNPRARISLPIRVRSADFVDDQVDEVLVTINMSRGGLYFISQRSSYHRGMKVLLTIPFRDFVADAGPEERGEVVRVEHFNDGRAGVAVRLLKSAESWAAHKVHPSRPEETKKSPTPEHRLAPRLPFLTEAEVMEATAGTWLKARLSDLSLSGCYVDTLHPLPVGARIRLRVARNKTIFEALATVVYSEARLGMGVCFTQLSPEQKSILVDWLTDIVKSGRP
jgi:c-di-GMP-binding flagellar brake protein YcgR